MKDLLIFSGAPGSGKTTIGELLQERLNAPLIDFGCLRQGHLNREWSNQSPAEEDMAFENLIFIVRNYLKHGYKNVILNDLREDKIIALSQIFKDTNFVIISLIITDDEVLRKRVLGKRDSGFKNAEASVEWNRKLRERETLPNEFKIDNTHNNPQETVRGILETIS
jgi:adenylate kinase family enzyme